MKPPHEPARWFWRGLSFIAAGGFALLGGLALSVFENAPSWVPSTGAVILVICYSAAGFLVFRHS
ncbi:MAG: hypothetical protein INR62_09415 [Rhodospirillales bacterium]|nr:hypothetical protein [Acetobacter sp.]